MSLVSVSLRNPTFISIVLFVLSLPNTLLPVFPGDYVEGAAIIAAISAIYYSIAMIWLWSALNVSDDRAVKGFGERLIFWTPPIALPIQKFLQRWESMNILSDGKLAYLAKSLVAIGTVSLIVCCLIVAASVARNTKTGREFSWPTALANGLCLLFMPLGVWVLWPKLKRIHAADSI